MKFPEHKELKYEPYYPLKNLIFDIDHPEFFDPILLTDMILSPIPGVIYNDRNHIWAAVQLILESEFSNRFRFNVTYVRWAVGFGRISYLEINDVRIQSLIDEFDKTIEFEKPGEIHNRFLRLSDISELEVIFPRGI